MTFSSPRNPFVGLRPFESHESILFFGRDEQTMELLQRLHQYHFVAVTGSSGCGKSSLIRAGLIPRLKAGYLVDDRDKWMITMMKPGQSPLCNLADAILNQLNNVNHNLNAAAFAEEIREQGIEAILNILNSLWKNNTNFFLLVDQFEELFRFVLNEREFNKRDEATDFVNILLELSRQPDLPIYVVITMRSDFIGDCAQFYGLPEAMNQSQYIVPRLNRVQLETIIEAPVRLFRDKINPALTAKLLNDVRVIQDELPLLQHALMRIWDHKINVHKSDELDLQDYEFIGGIEKALSNDADEALHGMSEEELGLTKKIFQALTAIDENGRKIRRPARLKDLEAITGANKEQLLTIINRFIEEKRSFLIINKTVNEDDLLIDISHESLIRQWGTLSAWVDEEAEACKNYLRLVESARLYQDKKKDWLTGSELQIALQWRKTFNPSGLWAKRYNENFEESIQYLKESERQWKAAQEEKEKERLRKLRNQRLFFAAAVVVIIVISWFTIVIYKNNIENKKQLALNYWKSSQTARAENNFLDALHLIAEAADISSDKELIQNLLIDGEAFLPQACLKNIFSQSDIINSAVFSPDGKWILTAANDGIVRIIDKTTGKQIGHDIKHQALVYSAVFSPDGKWILTASNDSTAALWEVASGKLIKSFKHKDHVTSAVFNPDEKQILTACADKYVRLWDVTTGTRIDSFKHRDNVTSAIFSPDGKLILTVSNNSAQLWNLTAGKQIYLLKHDDLVRSAVFSLSGKLILTASRDSTARLWDVPTGKQIGPVMKHNDEVRSVAFSPDEKRISTGSLDKFARLWDVATQKQIGPAMQHEGPIYNVAFSPDGKWLLTAGGDKTLRLWYLATLPLTINKINSFKHEHNIVTSAVFSPDTKTILTASWDKTARLWDVATGKQISSLKHDSVVTSAVFSTNGKLILTASWDSSARLWDAFTGKQIGPVMKHNTPLNSAVFSPDGKNILIASDDSTVYVWDIETRKQVTVFKHTGTVKSAVFSSDGRNILLASGDNFAYLLDTKSGKKLDSFHHENSVNNACFGPHDKWILTASWDNTARLWDAVTGMQIGAAMKHDNGVNSAVFSPDQKLILTSSFDSTARLWDVVTKKQIASFKHEAPLTTAVFSPDSKWILTASRDSTACLWEIEGDLDLPPDLFKLQAEAITGVTYNLETGETQCIPLEQWHALKEKYNKEAGEHYRICKNPKYNLWRRFNEE